MKKKILSALFLFVPVMSFAFEELEKKEEHKEIGIEFSVDYWVAFPSGNFNVDGKKYDLKNLGYEKAKDFGGKIIYDGIEHGLMNIIFTYTPIKFEAETKAKENITFKDFSANQGEKYSSTYDFNNYDLGLLWDIGHLKEKTEDRLDVRAGMSVRYLDGSVEFKSETGSEYKKTYSSVKPMIDIEAEVEVLPIYQKLTAEIILELQSYIWNDEYMHDFIDSIRINYSHLFIEAGYRVMKYRLKDDGIISKTTAEGGFLSAGLTF